MREISDFWITTESGEVLFCKTYNNLINDQMFGGLLTTLNLIAEEISHDELKNFTLSDKNYLMKKKHNCLFIMAYSEKKEIKKTEDKLDKISKKFFELYPIDWFKNEWDNDTCYFSNFDEVLAKLNEEEKDSMKKFWGKL